ncbi:MAG: T9SS type A sorting domain-containing protein [Chitinophagaceae bacterium]|nr:T9SS type A sorting domain-containing protein [Chitinophagaceae bacterium]
MKRIVPLLITTVLLCSVTNAQVLRAFSPRYYNPSVKGNIVYVSNSIISTSGVGSGTPGTGEVPPLGSSMDNNGNGINIDVDNPAPVTKLPFGSVWNYHGKNAAPPNDGAGRTWINSNYVLNGPWNVNAVPVNGPGKYGYSSGQTTCMPSGQAPTCTPGAGNKYISYYFRSTVNFSALELSTTFSSIQLNLLRNDGIVVYINGVERIRDNMPGGGIVYGTLASSNIAPGAAEAVSYNLSPAFFTSGNNTIAVEVHLSAAANADMSFDMQVLGLSDNGTFNSSTADLNLPSCSNVLFAGLYWGAGEGLNGGSTAWITGETSCKLKLPGAASYTTITSTQTDYYNSGAPVGFAYTGFQCFANITALVNTTNPNGTYGLANVTSPLGKNNAYGGWTIVIVYANPSLIARNLTVFDGCAVVQKGNAPVDFTLSGFLTPPTGPVSCELGGVVYDGDRSWKDSFAFKQSGAASFYNLTPNATAGTDDMWNSTIGYKGAVVATRNPAFNNTLGYDANIIDMPNSGNTQLGNNKSSATVRLASPDEMVIAHILTTSISQYNPTFSFDKTAADINGGSLVPGDSIRYQINYNNSGNDSSTNTIITDNLPAGTTYMPGTIKIGGVLKTDAPGDDEAEYDFANNRILFRVGVGANAVAGGKIGPGVGNNVEFKVVTASACKIVSCVGSLKNNARINYAGRLSGNALFDSSGVMTSGCIIKGPVISPLSGPCFVPKDTLLVNKCATLTVTLPWKKYAGYSFYSAMPFTPANLFNQYTPISISGIYWAYYTNGAGCSDTARISVIITICIDIDDDNDGIPDYVEFNNPVALQDANSNGIPNWKDPAYPGYVDNNGDGVNDNFDYGADSDNDGIPNFYDTDFPGFTDSNGDGVNDNADKDKDGIPNQYDLDSDNDGIPDVVESYGVDTNGDGIIDNYTDTDADGFSQNVDGNNTGVQGSGNGLGAQDLDGDGIPNYLDTDSDNDGIPDVREALGTDANNDGKLDAFTDANSDGIADNFILATALLKTGPDVSPVDGRADTYPNKNLDQDLRPNAYDLDSDGDGIADVIESGLPDANLNGIIDGVMGTNGWSTTVSGMGALNLRNTDGVGNPDYLDIDSDDDGIPDNIEGQSTAGYKMPVATDTDGDGIVNTYDNLVGFGGSGILVYDHDGDGTPDYRDLDSDGDSQPDIVEGNDFNLNGQADDLVTLTGLDTDADGLDNRFDSLNSVINVKGTSYRMGTGGTFSGDAAPGSRTTVQKKYAANTDRDWRFVGVVLAKESLVLNAVMQGNEVSSNWTILTAAAVDHFELERSNDNTRFNKVGSLYQPVKINELQNFTLKDDVSRVNDDILYYRIKVITADGGFTYSNIAAVRKPKMNIPLTLMPNPAGSEIALSFNAENAEEINIRMVDNNGRIVYTQKQKVTKGSNVIRLTNLARFSNGQYTMQVQMNNKVISQKFILFN